MDVPTRRWLLGPSVRLSVSVVVVNPFGKFALCYYSSTARLFNRSV